MRKFTFILSIILILILGLSLLACGEQDGEEDADQQQTQNDTDEQDTTDGQDMTDEQDTTDEDGGETRRVEDPKDKTVELAYVEWDSEVASTYVAKVVLEDIMGYDVELTPVSAAAMWTAVGTGDVDGMVAAWLETTHGHYLEQVEDTVDNLGPNLEGTRIGLVVPEYVTIDSIEELNDNADKFNGKIIGIDPGAGLMSATEKVLEEYNLTNFELVEGSGATMAAALGDAIENDEWVVVTGWTPHWKFGKWDLKYLEDPKGIYGGEEWISTIVRDDLDEDMPEVNNFLDNFYWTPGDMASLMVWNQEEGADPEENARRWVNQNMKKVNEWVPEKYRKEIEDDTTENEDTADSMEKEEIELAYVEWDSEVASTFVVKNVLEDIMGYDVELTPVSAAAMWTAVGTGDVDGMVAAWLKTTHEHYLEQVKDNVDNLGPNLEGTRIGLVVPEYVTIDSIEELNDNADKFDGKIIGIDPGAGLMSATEQVLEEYNLTNFELVEGSGATMAAALGDAIENDEWVVVTGWTPHWKFGKWDLKYLEDPKAIYGGEEWISTIVRDDLDEDMLEVYTFLNNFYWTPADMSTVMVWNQEEGADPDANAERWINENPEKVKEWVPEKYKDKVE